MAWGVGVAAESVGVDVYEVGGVTAGELAFEFACDEGYDHPAFTDWVWPDAAAATAADGALSATQMTAGDNE